MDVAETLAEQYENIDYWNLYRPLESSSEKRRFRLFEHLPQWMKRKMNGSRWYGAWQKNISDYDTVIIGNSLRGRDVIEYMRERNPHIRIIVHYTSLIGKGNRKDPRRYGGLEIEFSSFDEGDSVEWGIRYVPFYYSPLVRPLADLRKRNGNIAQDVFFVGMAYDRAEKLLEVHKLFLEQGIRDKMVIVRNPHRYYKDSIKKHLSDKHMTYDEIIEEILHSRCILEILQQGQRGISLRPMEAAAFQKKLITDNENIVNYDLYSRENVFILGVDPAERLKAFVSEPYKPVSDAPLEKYMPQYWLDALLFGTS